MSETPTPAASDEARGRGRNFMLSALVVAAIVILGLVITLVNVLGGGASTPPSSASTVSPSASSTPSSPASTSATSSADTDASVCGLTDVQLTGTVATAPQATWALVGTTAAPSISGQGPGKIDSDGYRSCYAHTPVGALTAAANYAAVGSNPPMREKFIQQATAPGPGRDALLRQPAVGQNSQSVRIQIAGFRMLRYTGTEADVDLAIRSSNGGLGGAVMYLQWSEGDWKIRVGQDGSDLTSVTQLPSLNGYVLWAGA